MKAQVNRTFRANSSFMNTLNILAWSHIVPTIFNAVVCVQVPLWEYTPTFIALYRCMKMLTHLCASK